MAPTVSIYDRGSAGDLNFRIVDITLDASYAAGGWALTPKQLGFGTNGRIVALSGISMRGGFFFEWDSVAQKLMVRDGSGAADAAAHEVSNSLAALNGIVVRFLAWGIGHG